MMHLDGVDYIGGPIFIVLLILIIREWRRQAPPDETLAEKRERRLRDEAAQKRSSRS